MVANSTSCWSAAREIGGVGFSGKKRIGWLMTWTGQAVIFLSLGGRLVGSIASTMVGMKAYLDIFGIMILLSISIV